MKNRKKFLTAFGTLMLTSVLLFSGCASTQPANVQSAAVPADGGDAPSESAATESITDIAIGTAAAGGAWYPIGAAMSDIINLSSVGLQATVQTTGGGVENCKLVNDGDTEIAITLSYLAYNAINAVDPYTDAMPNIAGMFGGLSVGVMQLVVPGDSPIVTYADLKGKKVAVGPAGGGAIIALTSCLEQYGVQYSEITPSYVTYDEGVTMMTDGNIDAAIVYGGIPTPAVSTLEAGGKNFRILTLTKEEQDAVLEEYPYFTPVSIPSEMYGLSEEVLTVGTPNIVICSADLPDDTVYNLCELFFTDENLSKIRDSQPSAKDLTLEGAPDLPIDMHPGAVKFFTEKGVM